MLTNRIKYIGFPAGEKFVGLCLTEGKLHFDPVLSHSNHTTTTAAQSGLPREPGFGSAGFAVPVWLQDKAARRRGNTCSACCRTGLAVPLSQVSLEAQVYFVVLLLRDAKQ